MQRILLVFFLSAWIPIPAASAGDFVIHVPDDCGNLRLAVENQSLSSVLEKLSGQLPFSLHFTVSADRNITVALDQQPVELLRKLLARDGFMLVERYDPVCDRTMPASLWVLGEGEYNADQAVRYTPPVAANAPEPERSAEEIEELKKQGHRKYMTPEERYNERIRRRLENRGAAMVSGQKETDKEQ